ncbi:MAG: hypothetical protein IJ598_08005 [Ruminococcus sp.]|nr:hypothetical protein [Ruminococcus sp.]
MFTFTIREHELLNPFLEEFQQYVNQSYRSTMRFLSHPHRAEFGENEKLVLITVNKSVYQNMWSFLRLNDSHMQYAAFACLENAVYAIRLYAVLMQSAAYRHRFITDSDFSLEECEKEIAGQQDEYDETIEHFSNIEFYSGIHSVNTFALKNASISSQLHEGNIFLGISCGEALSDVLQDEVRKNLIGAFLALSKHTKFFQADGVDETLRTTEDGLYQRFLEYLRR